ncbi:GntR family transcriptional regulator [Sporosarcina psychrophila]|uniref:GntR family transcriptional regulator n=1 Tax=Sporosarcina psychrophila TaxID=1476 RepID=UPI0030CEFD74
MTVSRDNPIAMYLQIANVLKQEILSGKIKPGEKIGSERELEERFQVSKITIRKAVEILGKEGLVLTSQGKGTFVKPKKVEQTLDQLQSLSDIIKNSGYHPQVKITKLEMVSTLNIFLQEKDSEIDSHCLYIERLHTVVELPIAFAQVYIPYNLGEKLTKNELENNTIYELLENKLGITLGEAIQSIEACPASEALGKVLDVPEGSPLLKAERLTYSTQNKLIEKITFYYRFDEYAFKIKLNRANLIPMWPPIFDK